MLLMSANQKGKFINFCFDWIKPCGI